ncbi:alpha/beta hydrolase [Rhodoferax aquaticus]|uniref:Alpha/beta hydrolase n=2 Tax=Rhodoferax aquaticus TaxID=2527691 RepID=A0A515EVQ5_9BURK|nr:alpha/beta hydrolase [Rhodoferax aquaticus]
MASTVWAQPKTCAMVLMHGKWGHPNNLAVFGRTLEAVCETYSIEMPWSRNRNYDQPYGVAIAEISAKVQALRAKGFSRVLLAGHSFGANAAMAYMVTQADVDGVIALAPGHSPALTYSRGIGKAAVDQARQSVAEGKGADLMEMDDYNQGKARTVRMRAEVLLSYFDPVGLGNMSLSASRFKRAVPFMWVIGTADPLYPAGPAYAFEKVPSHPASKYLVVEADHMATPDVAAAQVLEWVKSLP